jgi:hypothetical protein
MNANTIQVDGGSRLITVIMEGLTDAGLMALFNRLRTMRVFTDGYSVLFDARNIAKVCVTGGGVFNLAQASQKDENRMAIVVGAGIGFGMARTYEISG